MKTALTSAVIVFALSILGAKPSFAFGWTARRSDWMLQNEKTGNRFPGGGSKDGTYACEGTVIGATFLPGKNTVKLWVDPTVRQQVTYLDMKTSLSRNGYEDLRDYGRVVQIRSPLEQEYKRHFTGGEAERLLNPAFIAEADRAETVSSIGHLHTKDYGVFRFQQLSRPSIKMGDPDWYGANGYPPDYTLMNRCFNRRRKAP